MKRKNRALKVCSLTTAILLIACIPINTQAAGNTEGDLIAFDIELDFGETECDATIWVHNNDPDVTITSNFWVGLWMDYGEPNQRYLGEVYVTEDLSPSESYETDPINFTWGEGSHELNTKVDWRNHVHESNEGNNWYSEEFEKKTS
jgi:hypothetical protein